MEITHVCGTLWKFVPEPLFYVSPDDGTAGGLLNEFVTFVLGPKLELSTVDMSFFRITIEEVTDANAPLLQAVLVNWEGQRPEHGLPSFNVWRFGLLSTSRNFEQGRKAESGPSEQSSEDELPVPSMVPFLDNYAFGLRSVLNGPVSTYAPALARVNPDLVSYFYDLLEGSFYSRISTQNSRKDKELPADMGASGVLGSIVSTTGNLTGLVGFAPSGTPTGTFKNWTDDTGLNSFDSVPITPLG